MHFRWQELLNTQYMTNSTLLSPVKLEYGWNFSISGLKMMVKSIPLFTIIFRPEMLKFQKFHPYSILTGDSMVGFVIFCVLSQFGREIIMFVCNRGDTVSRRSPILSFYQKITWKPNPLEHKWKMRIIWFLNLQLSNFRYCLITGSSNSICPQKTLIRPSKMYF